MDIITTARHFEMTPEVRDHTERRLEKLRRYLGGVQEVHVTLATEKYRKIAEISLHAQGTEVVSRGVSDEMLTSIDRVVDRIERQLRRLYARRKRTRHLRRTPRMELAEAPPSKAEIEAAVAEDSEELTLLEEDFSPVVVRGDQYHPEPVSVEDAIEILRERDEDFLLFTNSQTSKVNLIYQRPDGNYGLVEVP
jgi:putative sigma-54 modulation protein